MIIYDTLGRLNEEIKAQMTEKNWQFKKESNLEKKHNPNRKRPISITISHETYAAIQANRRRLETFSTTIERLARTALNLPE